MLICSSVALGVPQLRRAAAEEASRDKKKILSCMLKAGRDLNEGLGVISCGSIPFQRGPHGILVFVSDLGRRNMSPPRIDPLSRQPEASQAHFDVKTSTFPRRPTPSRHSMEGSILLCRRIGLSPCTCYLGRVSRTDGHLRGGPHSMSFSSSGRSTPPPVPFHLTKIDLRTR